MFIKTAFVFAVILSAISALPILENVLGNTTDPKDVVGGLPVGNATDAVSGLPVAGNLTNTDMLNNLPIGDLPASDILNGGLLDSLKIGDLLKLGNLVKCEKTLKLLRIQIDVGIPLD